MFKNSIISLLGAALLIKCLPWSAGWTPQETAGFFIGSAGTLIIFCLFCQETAEKWRKYRARVRQVRETVERLRGGGGRK